MSTVDSEPRAKNNDIGELRTDIESVPESRERFSAPSGAHQAAAMSEGSTRCDFPIKEQVIHSDEIFVHENGKSDRQGKHLTDEVRLLPEGSLNSSGPIEDNRKPVSQGELDKKKAYRLALNRLRCVMITLVVFFHCSVTFEPGSGGVDSFYAYYVNPSLARQFMSDIALIAGKTAWPMFVFFTLAGYAAYHNIRSRGVKDFVQDRSLRLVPPIFFGLIILEPITMYLLLLVAWANGSELLQGMSFLEVLRIFYQTIGNTYIIGVYWYLIYLYIFCMLGIPPFLLWSRFRGPSVTSFKAKVAVVAVFLSFPFLVWSTCYLWFYLSDFNIINLFGEANNFFAFFLWIFFGFFLAWCKDAHELFLDSTWFFLGLSCSMAPLLYFCDVTSMEEEGLYSRQLLKDVYAATTMYCVWGLAHKVLPYLPRAMAVPFDYIADRAIAIYVLHMIVMHSVINALTYMCRGSFLQTETVSRFLLQFLFTYLGTLLVYETLFRWKYSKVLVGMARMADFKKNPGPTPKDLKPERNAQNQNQNGSSLTSPHTLSKRVVTKFSSCCV